MIVKATIKRDGIVVNEVLDRQQHLCSTVYQITGALGKQLSDEEIGPECDSLIETTTDGSGS